MNNLDVSVALATAPSTAFEELRQRPRFWFPLLLLTLTTVGMVFWYYSIVDIEWFKDTDPNFQKMPEEQLAMMSRNMLLWSSAISAIFIYPIICLVSATYLLVAAKITKLPQGFKHWYAFSAWSSLPVLISVVVAAILLILSDNAQVSPSTLQPLSLNELLFHLPLGAPARSMLESVHIPGILTWVLMIIGVRVWSQRSWLFSATFILLPTVVIYGIWAFFAFR